MSAFKVGDRVEWTSQAGGYTRTKVGEVVAVIPADTDPHNIVMPGRLDGPGCGRPEESYVVRVGPRSRRLYWPRVSHLRLAGMTPERAAYLSGVRAGLEAAGRACEDEYAALEGRLCGGGDIDRKHIGDAELGASRCLDRVRALSAESIAKEAADAAE